MAVLSRFQAEVFNTFISSQKGHFFCSAPTGSGKGFIVEEIIRKTGMMSVIIVPLNALGRQTAERLKSKGIRAQFFEGHIEEGIDVAILGPERLSNSRFRSWCHEFEIAHIFIDECHCIEDWGSGFRPVFKDIYTFLEEMKPRKTLWMSGTLPRTSFERMQIATGFEISVCGSFSLAPNLNLEFFRLDAARRFETIQDFFLAEETFRIFFCNTRKETENWARLCEERGIESTFYHAGLSLEERINLEKSIQSNPKAILFATSAFGMGMDFKHLDWSILTSVPYSLLSLVQALGRAGRGGRSGRGTVLWSETDFRWNSQTSGGTGLEELCGLRNLLEENAFEGKSRLLKEYFV